MADPGTTAPSMPRQSCCDSLRPCSAAPSSGSTVSFIASRRGFRTFALVSLGSAIVVIVMEDRGGPDAISRVIQGIMTGIGFLGAGVIFRREAPNKVSGLTTAAAIWPHGGPRLRGGPGPVPRWPSPVRQSHS